MERVAGRTLLAAEPIQHLRCGAAGGDVRMPSPVRGWGPGVSDVIVQRPAARGESAASLRAMPCGSLAGTFRQK